MVRNVLEYLENSAVKYPEKIALDDDKKTITYANLCKEARALGTAIGENNCERRPIAVFMPKGCDCVTAFLGVVYSGGFYCPIDVTMPLERISLIMDILKPAMIITNKANASKVEKFKGDRILLYFEDAICTVVNEEYLKRVRSNAIDTDPLYVFFTSGSTGVPKGVVLPQKSIIDLVEATTEILDLSDSDIWGNQAPFYFDLSVFDMYCALGTGATLCIIPKKKFAFPIDLLRYLDEKKITVIDWVPSVICNVANLKALDVVVPSSLKTIIFCGEVMPNKQLNVWRQKMPDRVYVNMYGPTEIAYACTYHIVKDQYQDDESLPIGKPFPNTKIIVLNEQNEAASIGEVGELCVAGSCLALGYYNNKEKTEAAFVRNPLNKAYSEVIYRTGDLVKYNNKGELLYLSRKDFQIKHLGHRIELGEIEAAMGKIQDIDNCACVYDENAKEICMCYTGQEKTPIQLTEYLKTKLTSYMLPQRYVYMKELPYNANGKIDRIVLKKIAEEMNNTNETR